MMDVDAALRQVRRYAEEWLPQVLDVGVADIVLERALELATAQHREHRYRKVVERPVVHECVLARLQDSLVGPVECNECTDDGADTRAAHRIDRRSCPADRENG